MAKYSNLGLLIQRREKLVESKNDKIKELDSHKPRTNKDRKRLGKSVIKNRRDISKITKEMYSQIKKRKATGEWDITTEV